MVNAMVWSVRRELWEHRWAWLVPTLAGCVVITIITAVTALNVAGLGGATPAAAAAVAGQLSTLLDIAIRIALVTGTIVAFVYCAEALNGERRDRSILFWNSLPVSDGIAVAAKACVPLCVVPLITFAVILLAQLATLIVVARHGIALRVSLATPGSAAVEVLAAALWTSPVYAWILLVSARARRAVLLLAFLPLMVIAMIERLAFGETSVAHALFNRGVGRYWTPGVPLVSNMTSWPALPLLRSPALWTGVILASVMLLAVAQQRRHSAARIP
jgi:ABC-2 type transport system permease protein